LLSTTDRLKPDGDAIRSPKFHRWESRLSEHQGSFHRALGRVLAGHIIEFGLTRIWGQEPSFYRDMPS